MFDKHLKRLPQKLPVFNFSLDISRGISVYFPILWRPTTGVVASGLAQDTSTDMFPSNMAEEKSTATHFFGWPEKGIGFLNKNPSEKNSFRTCFFWGGLVEHRISWKQKNSFFGQLAGTNLARGVAWLNGFGGKCHPVQTQMPWICITLIHWYLWNLSAFAKRSSTRSPWSTTKIPLKEETQQKLANSLHPSKSSERFSASPTKPPRPSLPLSCHCQQWPFFASAGCRCYGYFGWKPWPSKKTPS